MKCLVVALLASMAASASAVQLECDVPCIPTNSTCQHFVTDTSDPSNNWKTTDISYSKVLKNEDGNSEAYYEISRASGKIQVTVKNGFGTVIGAQGECTVIDPSKHKF